MSRLPINPLRFDFNLPAVFSAAVDFGRTVSSVAVDADAALTARARLLTALNPRRRPFGTDPQYRIELAHPGTCPRTDTPGHFDEVDLCHSLPTEDSRTALKTLAAAVILLSGDAPSGARGRELLGSGAWLLWQGMTEAERELVRARLPEAIRLWRWPRSRSGVLKRHTGPVHTRPGGLGHIDLSGWRSLSGATLSAQLGGTAASAEELFRHGQLVIDRIHVSDDRWVDITGLSCKVIPGSEPTACPDADPPLPPTVLAEVPRAIRRSIPLPDGLTIHWVGHNAGYRGRCRCHPDAPTAAPADRARWPVPIVKPLWDRAHRQLRFRNAVIRDYSKRRAKNQERLLDKFQEVGWETTVEAPFDGRALKEAIDAFNDTVEPNTIRLGGDGTGKGVSWLPVRATDEARA